jgi:acetolactate synthase-1/2/3 large subunit
VNGAEALLRTLCATGIDTCFSNPGTSEMHFVAAMDRVAGVRGIPVLAEGVATGAADGYGRMARRPAATLLHCGPGLANGIANLHNARRARSPVVNLIGDLSHAHRPADAPLACDTESLARVVSSWTRVVLDVHAVSGDGAAAVAAAMAPGTGVASLILPSDVCWTEGAQAAAPRVAARASMVASSAIEQGAAWAALGPQTVLLLGGEALYGEGLAFAGAIARRTGARLMAESAIARIERGRGRPAVERVPYAPAAAIEAMASVGKLLLVGARRPVFSFAGPDGRSRPERPDVEVAVLAHAEEDIPDALARLASALGCETWPPHTAPTSADPALPATGAVSPEAFVQSLAALLPEAAIVVDESVSFGRGLFPRMSGAAPHDWLQLTGGAIGSGMPMATGAAVACLGRRVVNLQADGSALYTVQSLWTQAREGLDVTTVILSNRRYAILFDEMSRVGAAASRTAHDLLSLDRPCIDWSRMANAFGVEAERAETMDAFNAAFSRSLGARGPRLIELVL